VAGIVIIAIHSSSPQTASPVAYTNISRNFKVCLLATTKEAATTTPDWVAIQKTARHKNINAQRIVAPNGPTKVLLPYLNSLIALQCGLIVTAEPNLTDALVTIAGQHLHTMFANISQDPTSRTNIKDMTDNSNQSISDLITNSCQC
jgi:hypothetical protein